jgi:hypothetical protein
VSARIIPLPRQVAWTLSSDFKTSLLCWGGFILVLSCYCALYQVVVDGGTPDLSASFRLVLKNWGVWLVTTPLVFAALRRYSTKWHDRAVWLVALVALIVFISAAVPVGIDLLTNARDAASSLMIFLPRYVAVVAVVYLIWHVFLRDRRVPAQAVEAHPPALRQEMPAPQDEWMGESVYAPAGKAVSAPLSRAMSVPLSKALQAPVSKAMSQPVADAVTEPLARPRATPAPAPQLPATLLVNKGADQCLIQINRIECVSAAGNYVEIIERGQRYLMRAPLKQVEDLLPSGEFIRIHRSHLVRLDQIERIKSLPSGNGTVQLRGGQVLPMSKRYKQALQRYRRIEPMSD